MKECCADVTVEMQETVEAGKFLKLFLAASPFILLLPDLVPGGSAREVAGAVAEKVAILTAEKALTNINKGMAKPDFVNAIQAVDIIVLGTLSGYAAKHMLKHHGTKDANVWQKLAEAYSPTVQRGGNGDSAPKGESWFPWSWFE